MLDGKSQSFASYHEQTQSCKSLPRTYKLREMKREINNKAIEVYDVEFDEEVRAGGSGQLLREDWGGWAKMTQDGDPKLQAEGRALEEKGRMASIRRFGLSKPLYVKVG